MTAALRRLGFDRVFDTGFTADLTIMEEASELVHRLKNGGTLPMLTSCSPGWIKFVETFYPDFIDNLSTCKSPQQMMGAVIKSYFAEREGIDPQKIFSVSIMPCTAKKFEAGRPEMGRDGVADVDAVLTTRELAQMIRMRGLDLTEMPARDGRHAVRRADHGRQAVRRHRRRDGSGHPHGPLPAHRPRTGRPGRSRRCADWTASRRPASTSTASTLGVAVVSGLGNARRLLDQIRAGRNDLHFIEVMTCPGGCIARRRPAARHRPERGPQRGCRRCTRSTAQEPLRTSHSNAVGQAAVRGVPRAAAGREEPPAAAHALRTRDA